MELHSKLRNSAFRNSFCLYKNYNFVLIFVEDFTTMNFPLYLAPRQQPSYSTL